MMLSTYSSIGYRFATGAVVSGSSIASKTFAKFQQKYASHLQSFSKKTNDNIKQSQNIKRTTQKAFAHPYCDQYHKPYHSALEILQHWKNYIGSQQISPHYQNFMFARKDYLLFIGCGLSFYFISTIPDFHYVAKAFATCWVMFFGVNYLFMEGKNYLALPIFVRFYLKITKMEAKNLQSYYNENMEVRIRSLMAAAKFQMDYKTVHNNYLQIRNNTLLNFLINEQISTKNHLHQRAQNILKRAQTYQKMNHSKIISGVLTQILNSIDKAYTENKQQIQREMFTLALDGIIKGKMDYSNDPFLPIIGKTIQKTIDQYDKISPEEQLKIIALKPEQIQEIKREDVRERDQFLKNQPKIDGSLKKHQVVMKILNRWGKQAQ